MIFFWDIDGTLMHCGAAGTRALERAFAELFGTEGALADVRVGRAMDCVLLDRVFAEHGLDAARRSDLEAAFARHLVQILEGDATKRVLPGVRRLLELAAGAGHINALLTSNLESGARIKLESVGLYTDADGAPVFQAGGFGDSHREKYLAAAAALAEIAEKTGVSTSPREVVILGDGLYDLETAQRLGCRAVAVGTGWTPVEELKAAGPDFFFEDLSDAETVFEKIVYTK
ncbi:MAG: haloacid dehalogenase-like hydrolase [Clostridiales Family XIII bacterium]|jgi:phosphoglycolate phosphatase-like HAD superfamily hydrolase|nr:haloacid dehalogenase-like hydrolase [Clostridiales Family XIII bacterium]